MTELWEFTDQFGETFKMERAPWWFRLPIVRHFRALKLHLGMMQHYSAWGLVCAVSGPRAWEIAYIRAVWKGDA